MIGVSEFHCQATEILQSIRPNSTFLTVHHYMNNWGEVADFSLCFHVDYKKSVQRAKNLLETFRPQEFDLMGRPYSINHLRQAREELLKSYDETLSGERNSRDTSSQAYNLIVTSDGEPIPGIKLHRNQDVIHLVGFGLHKKILMPGNYGPDRRQALTIAKDDLRAFTPLGNFRQFHLEKHRFQRIVVNKLTILEEDVIRTRTSSLIVKNGWRNEEMK